MKNRNNFRFFFSQKLQEMIQYLSVLQYCRYITKEKL